MDSRSKNLFFAGLMILIPVVMLVTVEAVLRLTGVERDARTVFADVPGKTGAVALNPSYVRRYFSSFVPGVAFNPFFAEKPDSTYRVFVLGGSTAAGFPYRYYYGFPARLEDRLIAARFGQQVEVINLGMSAVNSYTVWDLARTLPSFRPDAVIAYTGHNEFYGALGVGSTESGVGRSVFLKRLILRLRRSATYSAMERLIVGPPPPPAPTDRTLMAQIVADAGISSNSSAFEAGVDQFESNLTATMEIFEDAGIPLYVGTLTSNLADQAPFSDHPEAAERYEAGRSLQTTGDTLAAREAYMAAKELDEVRFRAPEVFNQVIRSAAEAHGAHVVETSERFRAESPGGLESDYWFTDHLHPNAAGYDLMAESFFDAMHEGFEDGLSYAPDAEIDPLEASHAGLLLARLKGDYPYNKTESREQIARTFVELVNRNLGSGNPADSIAAEIIRGRVSFPAALNRTLSIARAEGDTLAALRIYRALLAWQPFNASLIRQAVSYALDSPAFDDQTARLALWASRHMADVFPLSAAAAVRLRAGRLDDAERLLQVVEQRAPDDPTALYNLARLRLQQGDTTAASLYFSRYQAGR